MTRRASRYHRIDGWRGYTMPGLAVAGASDTGTWDGSPCPTPDVVAEIRRFQREALRPARIKSRTRMGHSSNIFCGKRWVCVAEADFDRAARLTVGWMASHNNSTRFIHDADLDQIGYR